MSGGSTALGAGAGQAGDGNVTRPPDSGPHPASRSRSVPSCPRQLSAILARGNRQVTLQVHPVVQDSTDFDHPLVDDAIQQEVPSAPSVPGDMERAEARHDLVARP
jgi:hypothetical protein